MPQPTLRPRLCPAALRNMLPQQAQDGYTSAVLAFATQQQQQMHSLSFSANEPLTWHVAPSSEMSMPSSFSTQWRGAVAPASPSLAGGHSSAELFCTVSTMPLTMAASRWDCGAVGGARTSGTPRQRLCIRLLGCLPPGQQHAGRCVCLEHCPAASCAMILATPHLALTAVAAGRV